MSHVCSISQVLWEGPDGNTSLQIHPSTGKPPKHTKKVTWVFTPKEYGTYHLFMGATNGTTIVTDYLMVVVEAELPPGTFGECLLNLHVPLHLCIRPLELARTL